MIKVETPFHFITSDNDELPHYVCDGKCKSAWWKDEPQLKSQSVLHTLNCPKCGGHIRAAKESDYKVIDQGSVTHLPNTAIVHAKHEVKPEFEDMAKREWC